MNRKTVNVSLAALVGVFGIVAVLRGHLRAEREKTVTTSEGASLAGGLDTMRDRSREREERLARLIPRVPIREMDYDFLREVSSKVARGGAFQTFSPEGGITKGALEFVGVDGSRRREVQAVVDNAYRQVEASIVQRMKLVAEESDEASGVAVYEIPAARAEGEMIFREMAGNIQNIIGESKTLALVSGMNLHERYSFFGMNDVRIEIRETGDGAAHPENAFRVDIFRGDPNTKEWVRTGTGGFRALKARYGGVFATETFEK